ncbi:MAG: hypothetical protein RIC38_10530 [Chromatocurvus sp.]
MNSINEPDPVFGEPVFSYTRAQALADGVLVDAGEPAQEAGFRYPVALTVAAWEDCVAWTVDDNRRQTHQDVTGRLWDVLFMAAFVSQRAPAGSDQILFLVARVPRDGQSTSAVEVSLKLVIGPGDAG